MIFVKSLRELQRYLVKNAVKNAFSSVYILYSKRLEYPCCQVHTGHTGLRSETMALTNKQLVKPNKKAKTVSPDKCECWEKPPKAKLGQTNTKT